MINTQLTKILIIGYGSQAKAWALNLRDSGYEVSIGLRESSNSKHRAIDARFTVINPYLSKLSQFSFIIFLTPDHTHAQILQEISANLLEGQNLVFAHGYSFTYLNLQENFPKFNYLLLAPKAIASEVRFNYETKSPLTAVIDKGQVTTNKEATNFAFDELVKSLGINVGPIESTFKEETKADLFSEQSLLCSLIPYGARRSFEKLVNDGVNPEIAYIECWHEVKLIANTMTSLGPTELFKLISPNALIGGNKAQKLIFNRDFDKILDKLQKEIENGQFFQEVSNTDFHMTQTEVVKDWSETKLQEVYNSLGKRLVHESKK